MPVTGTPDGQMNLDRADSARGDILVVDDTPDNLHLLSAMLKDRGYEVRAALSGKMALTAVQSRVPDVILLDIKMPDLDGYQVCEYLKADPQTRQIPVIFLSALDQASDKVKGFCVGAADYITKPFQEAEVLVRVEHQVALASLRAQLEQQNQLLRHEIRDRVAAERQLQRSNRELLRSNEDLEQFARAASHDLQQPLQSIIGFAKILLLNSANFSEVQVHEYLSRIVNAGNRMQQLIEDLLAYSQVGALRSRELVDCNAVLEEAIANLQVAISEKHAHLSYDRLPYVTGSGTQLMQLFQNLLSNALKFSNSDVPPTIQISLESKAGEWVFAVSDNGIGIAPQNFDRIFQVFQRLHPSDRYAGTGIGLATCKKIVEGHGGRIWVKSHPESGTTFFFTLPKPSKRASRAAFNP